MTITINGKAFECSEWKITTTMDANPKIKSAALLYLYPKMKSGDLRSLYYASLLSQISQKIPLIKIPSSRITQILGD